MLSMHTIRANVREQVLLERLHCEIQQIGVKCVRQGQRSNEQRIEFQRAVIALCCEMIPQIPGLLRQAGYDPLLQRFSKSGKMWRIGKDIPGIDPVLNASPMRISGTELYGNLPNPGVHQLSP